MTLVDCYRKVKLKFPWKLGSDFPKPQFHIHGVDASFMAAEWQKIIKVATTSALSTSMPQTMTGGCLCSRKFDSPLAGAISGMNFSRATIFAYIGEQCWNEHTGLALSCNRVWIAAIAAINTRSFSSIFVHGRHACLRPSHTGNKTAAIWRATPLSTKSWFFSMGTLAVCVHEQRTTLRATSRTTGGFLAHAEGSTCRKGRCLPLAGHWPWIVS